MSDITSVEDLDKDATANGTEVVEAIETAPATEVTAAEEPKTISLDDALAKAFEKHTPVEDDGKPKAAVPGTEAPAATTKLVDPITGRESEPMKAPAGWTPLLKEKWSGIDPTVQKFIADRERDMAQNISKTADARKLEYEFKDSVVTPHEDLIRQFNVPAMSIVKDVMGQWAQMTKGSPQVRAQIIHTLIQHYKPDIQTLTTLASGGQVQTQSPVQPNVQELVQKELEAREAKQQEAQILTDIEAFGSDPKNEYFENVRDEMGAIVTAGLIKDAKTLPELFKKAYDLACSQHPEINQILAARKVVTPAAAPAPVARPVGSIKPSLGSGIKGKPAARAMSLDDAVAEAVRRHSS